MFCLEGKCLPVRRVRHGGSRRYRTFLLQVFGLALIRLSQRPRGREARTRTSSIWSQARRAYPYATSRSGPAESNRVSPDSGSGRLPSSSIPVCAVPSGRGTVEMAGIEPAATTLAGRVRYLSCHPHGDATPGTASPRV